MKSSYDQDNQESQEHMASRLGISRYKINFLSNYTFDMIAGSCLARLSTSKIAIVTAARLKRFIGKATAGKVPEASRDWT